MSEHHALKSRDISFRVRRTRIDQQTREGGCRYSRLYSEGLNSACLPLLCGENCALLVADSEAVRENKRAEKK